MDIKINFELQIQDYVDFNKYHFIKTKLNRTITIGVIILIVIQLFLNRDQFHLATTIITSIVFALIYLTSILRSLNNTKKIPKDDRAIFGKRELEFTEDGITNKSEDSNGYSKWSTIKNMQESSNAFYLYMGTNVAILIPKRCFDNITEMNEFQQYVKSKINNA